MCICFRAWCHRCCHARSHKHKHPLARRSRALVSSERLQLPPELWVQTLRELLVPVVTGGSGMHGAACIVIGQLG